MEAIVLKEFIAFWRRAACLLFAICVFASKGVADANAPLIQLSSAHSGTVVAAAISPNGDYIVSVGRDAKIVIWSVESFEAVHRFPAHNLSPVFLEFSPDGQKFLITYETGSNDSTQIAILYDLATAKPVWPEPVVRVNLGKGAFSPSDNLLAFEQYDYGVVLVDTATGSVLGELEQPNEILSDVEFSPDGAFLLGAPWGGTTLYVWDVASRKIVRRVNVRNYVERLTYSGSGNNYILGRSFGTTSLLDLGSGSSIDLGVSSAGGEVVLAGGNIVLSDGEYSSRFVEIKPGQSDPLATYDARVGYGSSQTKALAVGLANNKDEFLTVTYVATDGELTLARFGGPEKTRLFYRVYEEVNRSAIIPGTRAELSNDKRYLAVEHRGLPTVIWDLQSGAPATRSNAIDMTKWREGFVGIEYEKDGSRNVVHWSGREGIVVETKVAEAPPRQEFSGSDTATLGYFTAWDHLYAIDMDTGQNFGFLDSNSSGSVELSPGRRFLAAGRRFNEGLKVFRLGGTVSLLREFDETIDSFAWHPDGATLALAGSGGIRVWNAQTSRDIGQLFAFPGLKSGRITAQSFSPSGRYFLAVDQETRVRVWDVSSVIDPRLVHDFFSPVDSVSDATWIEDDLFVLTGSGVAVVSFDAIEDISSIRLLEYQGQRWAAVADDGRFDGNRLENIAGLHWVLPEDLLRPIPVDVFLRERFTPGLVGSVLDCWLNGERIEQACASLALDTESIPDMNRVQPQVSIENVTQGAEPDTALVTVRIAEFEDPTQTNGKTRSGAYDLRLLRNGQVIAQYPDAGTEDASADDVLAWRRATQIVMLQGEDSRTLTFSVRVPSQPPGGTVQFSAYAFNEDRVKSQTARAEPYPVPDEIAPIKPRAYLLAIGVDSYDEPSLNLSFAVEDARELLDVMSRLDGYDIVQIPLISEVPRTNRSPIQHATKANVEAVFEMLSGEIEGTLPALRAALGDTVDDIHEVGPDDLVVVVFSGHGYADTDGRFFLLPTDSGQATVPWEERVEKMISSEDLTRWFRGVDAGTFVMIIDACHSAASVPPGFKPGPFGDRGLGQLAYDKGMRILAATQASDVAIENNSLANGLMSYALIEEAFVADAKGRARADTNSDRRVSVVEWLSYAERRVPSLYVDLQNGALESKGAILVETHLTDTVLHAQTPVLFDFDRNLDEIFFDTPD